MTFLSIDWWRCRELSFTGVPLVHALQPYGYSEVMARGRRSIIRRPPGYDPFPSSDDGTVEGRPLQFDPEAVWRQNMVMRDRETGTLWQHATGEAILGPLEGTRLDVLGGQLMTWGAWKADHPETTLTRDTTAGEWNGILSKAATYRVLADDGVLTAVVPRLARRDDRLGPLTEVVGVEVGEQARAYPLATLEQLGALEDEVGGVPVSVTFDRRGGRVDVEATDATASFKRTRWLEWSEFHPETSVFSYR